MMLLCSFGMIQSAMQPSTAVKKTQNNSNCVFFVCIKICKVLLNYLCLLRKGNKWLIDFLHGNSRTPVTFLCMGIDFTMSLIGRWRATNSSLYFLGLALNRNSFISSVVCVFHLEKIEKKLYWHKMHVAILSLARLKIVLGRFNLLGSFSFFSKLYFFPLSFLSFLDWYEWFDTIPFFLLMMQFRAVASWRAGGWG